VCGINVFVIQIDYVKISNKEDDHIFHTNFAKKWNKIIMKQLANGQCMENVWKTFVFQGP
jgi:hypothetical protein